MKFRTALVLLMVVALAVFALANWAAFAAPTALSLGFVEFEAPLGLLMLVLTGAVSGLLLGYILMQQAGAIAVGRRYVKELGRAQGTGPTRPRPRVSPNSGPF